MDIRSRIADTLRRQIRDYGKPLAQFSEDFDIPLTSLKSYVRGDTNLRADSIDMLAEKLGVTPAALISDFPSNWDAANDAFRAAGEFARWPKERQEHLVTLILALVQFFSEQGAENPHRI